MYLKPKRCPCGCSKIILEPLCGCQCSSVTPEEAREVMVRVNTFVDLRNALIAVLDNPICMGTRQHARSLLKAIEEMRTEEAKFPE